MGSDKKSGPSNLCPAKANACRLFSRMNHFASVCSRVDEVTTYKSNEASGYTEYNELYPLGSVASQPVVCDHNVAPWRVTLDLGHRPIACKTDTGPDVS